MQTIPLHYTTISSKSDTLIAEKILSIILHDPEIPLDVLRGIPTDLFPDGLHKQLLSSCLNIRSSGNSPSRSEVLKEGLQLGFINSSNIDLFNTIAAVETNKSIAELVEEFNTQGNRDNPVNGEVWEPPIPFVSLQTVPFPDDILPSWLNDFVKALAIQSQVPFDMPALLSLATVAIPTAKMYKIQARPGWEEPLNLYAMAILESGNRKSGTEKELLAPVNAFEAELISQYKPICEQSKHDLDCKKAALEDLKKQYIKARNGPAKLDKYGNPTGKMAVEIKADIEDLINEIADFEEVFLPTVLADDITMERLVILLSENQGNLGIFAAEGTLFGIAAGRYSGTANFDDLLKAHAGDPIKHDRVGRGRVSVLDPALTIGMCVQPIVLQELAQNPVFRLKGLQARFLYSIPESPLGTREINSPAIPEAIKKRYHEGIRTLLGMAWDVRSKKTILLSPEANELLMEFERWLEPKLRPAGELRAIVDWAAKLSGVLLRIAGILHIAEHCNDEIIPLTVDVSTISKAIQLQEFLISNARKAFDNMDIDNNDVSLCKRALAWISEEPGRTEFKKRDMFCALQGTFKKVEHLDPILSMLVEHNFIREKDIPKAGPGRKSQVFEINPLTAKYALYAKCNCEEKIADIAGQ